MSFGLDYVTGPPVADLKAAGVTFVCRYLSEVNALTRVKLLTAEEAKTLEQAGISVVSNYEWYATRALEGFASGVADAQIAEAQHAACGGPSDRPIYFSVDCDVAGSQTFDYFKGIASVIGLHRTGAYGSYRVIRELFDAGLITWGWQTYAWSYGAWEPRAHIEQYSNGVNIAGHSVDYDRSTKSDFGQWMPGQGELMPLLQLSDPMGKFFTASDDSHWHCTNTNQPLSLGFLSFFRQHGGMFGLPLTGEFRLPDYPNATFQIFERAGLVYNPQHDFDSSPGLGDIFLLHLDKGPGQAIVAKPLLNALQGQVDTLTKQVADLTTELATLKAQLPTDTSALEQQLSDAQAQLASFKQAVASVEATCAALPK